MSPFGEWPELTFCTVVSRILHPLSTSTRLKVDLLVLPDVSRPAGGGRLHEPGNLCHRAGGRVPVFGPLDVDPQQGQVRVLQALREPSLVELVPELLHLVAVADNRGCARDGDIAVFPRRGVTDVDVRVSPDLFGLGGARLGEEPQVTV